MANEITKMKSPRKISFLQNNKELIPYPEGNNEEAILNCG